MYKAIVFFTILFFTSDLFAEYVNQENQQQMSKVGFIVGNWSGSGWMLLPDKTKSTFKQTEKVEWKLQNTAILIEGRGVDDSTNEISHHAMAVISWKNKEQKFQFSSVLANGRDGLFDAKVTEGGAFVWWMESSYGTRRFTIKLNDQDQWFEVGEFSKDGEKWVQFFEMTLTKDNE